MTIETLRKKTKMRIAVAALLVATPFLIYSVSASAGFLLTTAHAEDAKSILHYDLKVTATSIETGQILQEKTQQCEKFEECLFVFDDLVPCPSGKSRVQSFVTWQSIPFGASRESGHLVVWTRVNKSGQSYNRDFRTDSQNPKTCDLRGCDDKKYVRLTYEIIEPKKGFFEKLFNRGE